MFPNFSPKKKKFRWMRWQVQRSVMIWVEEVEGRITWYKASFLFFYFQIIAGCFLFFLKIGGKGKWRLRFTFGKNPDPRMVQCTVYIQFLMESMKNQGMKNEREGKKNTGISLLNNLFVLGKEEFNFEGRKSERFFHLTFSWERILFHHPQGGYFPLVFADYS